MSEEIVILCVVIKWNNVHMFSIKFPAGFICELRQFVSILSTSADSFMYLRMCLCIVINIFVYSLCVSLCLCKIC